MPQTAAILFNPDRVRAVFRILGSNPSQFPKFDHLASVGCSILSSPVCLVSLVSFNKQCFLGASGLPPDLEFSRETPLRDSLCKHAVVARDVIVMNDVHSDSRVMLTPLLLQKEIRAYLGCPLINKQGICLGSFCAIDHTVREWTNEEIGLVRDFALIVVEQFEKLCPRINPHSN